MVVIALHATRWKTAKPGPHAGRPGKYAPHENSLLDLIYLFTVPNHAISSVIFHETGCLGFSRTLHGYTVLICSNTGAAVSFRAQWDGGFLPHYVARSAEVVGIHPGCYIDPAG